MTNKPGGLERVEWQAAVFCQNERSRIAVCITSVAAAMGSRRGLITIVINGSTDDSEAACLLASAGIDVPVQIFSIPHGDKSNAINVFIHDRRLRADADLYFFVDGYVTINADAFNKIAMHLASFPGAVAAAGIPGNGRTEVLRRAAKADGVLRGQLYCLTPDLVRRMADGGIRLPVGLYRGDGLLGSMAAHDLDAMGQPWVDSRVAGVAGAVYLIDTLSPFRLRDLRRQFFRKTRQMRGIIENAAIQRVIYAGGYAALPDFADDLIRDFLATHPVPVVSLADRVFMRLALGHHRVARTPDHASLQPRRIA